jgi:LmbE family N-acetylglucosaminyl deacetylase
MEQQVMRAILAPHCDDETLGCGGLLAKYPDESGVIVLTGPDTVRGKEFFRAQEILGYQVAHSLVFESLSEDQIDRKVEALEAYASQSVTGPHPVNSIKQMAHAIGAARQITWAEQYALVRQVRV